MSTMDSLPQNSQPSNVVPMENHVNGTINILLLGAETERKANFVKSCWFHLVSTSLGLEFDSPQPSFFNGLFGSINNPRESLMAFYKFPIKFNNKQYILRILNAAGFKSSFCEIDIKNEMNCDNILSSIANQSHLNTICLLIPTTISQCNDLLFYILQIMKVLQPRIAENLILIFEEQGLVNNDNKEVLNYFIKRINDEYKVYLPKYRLSMLCIENYRHENFRMTYKRSSKQFFRLINEITKRDPIELLYPITINKMVNEICKWQNIVVDYLETVDFNLRVFESCYNTLEQREKSPNLKLAPMLRNSLFILDYEIAERPTVVCLHNECLTSYQVGLIDERTSPGICCNECRIDYCPREIINSYTLQWCKYMVDEKCQKCGHHQKNHRIVHYTTKIKRTHCGHRKPIPYEPCRPDNRREFIKQFRQWLRGIQWQFKQEKTEMLITCFSFDRFLTQQEVLQVESPIKNYLQYLCNREAAFVGATTLFNPYYHLLHQYKDLELRFIYETRGKPIDCNHIHERINKLLTLSHFGPHLKRLYNLVSDKLKFNINQLQIDIPFSDTDVWYKANYNDEENSEDVF